MKILYLNERAGRTTGSREYVVTKAVNTAIFGIGEVLSLDMVGRYCSSPNWKVIITKKQE
jgi:hypothetical protein